MEKLGYQLDNTIVSHIVEQLRAAEDYNQLEPLAETPAIISSEPLAPTQANATQDIALLMYTMMHTMEMMSAQLANQNNGDNDGGNRHHGGCWRNKNNNGNNKWQNNGGNNNW